MNDERNTGVERPLPNLSIPNPPDGVEFTPVNNTWGSQTSHRKITDRKQHAEGLENQFNLAWRTPAEQKDGADGSYLTFQVRKELEYDLNKLENYSGKEHVELRSTKPLDTDNESIQANVFVPTTRKSWFERKLKHYRDSDGEREAALIENIDSISPTGVAELWTDPVEMLPDHQDEERWWEIWLSTEGNDNALQDFRRSAASSGVKVNSDAVHLNERVVTLAYCSSNHLEMLVRNQTTISELRHPNELTVFIASRDIIEQTDWAADLLARLTTAGEDAPAVCVLDQGVYWRHPLLSGSLPKDDCFSAKESKEFRKKHDPVAGDHGTEMAGLALYYDLSQHLQSSSNLDLKHRLESVKIIPNEGQNKPQIYGGITAMGVSRPEINTPGRSRVFMLAVTARRRAGSALLRDPGLPTAWSATLDALAFGRAVDTSADTLVYLDRDEPRDPRLFIVSVGNIDITSAIVGENHLDRSDISPIEDPSQAWNVISVGSYSEHEDIDPGETLFSGYAGVAKAGDLSPVSRTGVALGSKWPMKPDVVESGGNWAVSPAKTTYDKPVSFQQLTTRRSSHGQQIFTTTSDTSAATARVAAIAADIMAAYPHYKVETVRGLVVHSARWTEQMLRAMEGKGLTDRALIVRRYGMGVPSLERAVSCAENSINLITEGLIRPFNKKRSAEVVWHDLPWPKAELLALGAEEVRMRVTLSYFIEPNPSSRGWAGRYAYQSYGLRFDTKDPEETTSQFHARINAIDRSEDYVGRSRNSTSGWFLGPRQRKTNGSIHSDIWIGSAAELAEMGEIAVYPVSGWWKDRPKFDQSHEGVTYSLIISLETDQKVDLWTPVYTEISSTVEIST